MVRGAFSCSLRLSAPNKRQRQLERRHSHVQLDRPLLGRRQRLVQFYINGRIGFFSSEFFFVDSRYAALLPDFL